PKTCFRHSGPLYRASLLWKYKREELPKTSALGGPGFKTILPRLLHFQGFHSSLFTSRRLLSARPKAPAGCRMAALPHVGEGSPKSAWTESDTGSMSCFFPWSRLSGGNLDHRKACTVPLCPVARRCGAFRSLSGYASNKNPLGSLHTYPGA